MKRKTYSSYGANQRMKKAKTALAVGRHAANVIGSAWKAYRSRTQTKTKTIKKIPDQEYESSTATVKKMTVKMHKRVKGVDYLTRYILRDGRCGSHTTVSGRQKTLMYYAFGTRSQMLDQTPTATVAIDQGQYPLFWLNPNQKVTGNVGATFTENTTAGSQFTQAMYWDSLSLDMEYTNGTSIATYIDLFIVTPKVTTANLPDADWVSSIAQESFGQPVETFPASGGAVVTAGPGVPDIDHVGMRPFESKAWKQNWKILAMKKMLLPQGGSTQRLKVSIDVNKVLKYQQIQDAAANYIAGTSILIFGIQRGGCVNDNIVDFGTYSSCFTPHLCQGNYILRNMKATNGKQETKYGYSRIPTEVPTVSLTTINTESLVAAVVNSS